MHIYKSRFLVRGEVWFDHEPDQTTVDWILYRQRSRPVRGARCSNFYTRVLDLTQNQQVLFQQMSKSNAYKIRRARDKDGVHCESLDAANAEVLDDFEQAYNRFAAAKQLAPLNRPLLAPLAQKGLLDVSVAKDPGGKPLAYHAYYRDSRRSCLLHAISLHQTVADSTVRNAMGRANRWLFWCDILRHQQAGLKLFDFGGWYPGHTNQELLAINEFKEGFGGSVVPEYNCQQVLSLKGWIVLKTAALLDSRRLTPAHRRAGSLPRRHEQTGSEAGFRSSGIPAAQETVGAQKAA